VINLDIVVKKITSSIQITGSNHVQISETLSYIMNIWAASIRNSGIDLCYPVFSHGQFYVAVSHARNWIMFC
jgi:hypothetical protein